MAVSYFALFAMILAVGEIIAENHTSFLDADIPLPELRKTQITRNGKAIPAGYEVIPCVGALKLYTTTATWNQARNKCILDGAHLAVINSTIEKYVVLQMAKENGISTSSLWVGLHDIFAEGDWVSVEDVPMRQLGWNVWTSGQPSVSTSWNCATLLSSGKLDDNSCTGYRPYICKIAV